MEGFPTSNGFSLLQSLMEDHLKIEADTSNEPRSRTPTLMDMVNKHLDQYSAPSFQDPSMPNFSFFTPPKELMQIKPGSAITSADKRNIKHYLCSLVPDSVPKLESHLEELIASDYSSDEEMNIEESLSDTIDKPKEDELSDEDLPPFDLTDCIIKPEDRLALIIATEQLTLQSKAPLSPINYEDLVLPPPTPVMFGPELPCLFNNMDYYKEQCIESRRKYEQSTLNMSPFAKVMCFSMKLPVPKINFKYHEPSDIKFFKFDTPSPDEIALENLNKRKNMPYPIRFLEP